MRDLIVRALSGPDHHAGNTNWLRVPAADLDEWEAYLSLVAHRMEKHEQGDDTLFFTNHPDYANAALLAHKEDRLGNHGVRLFVDVTLLCKILEMEVPDGYQDST